MGKPQTSCRAKFYISGLELRPGAEEHGVVRLSAVSRGDRNAAWAKASPSGSLEMHVNNPAGFAWFKDLLDHSREAGIQPELYLDFTVADDGYPGDGHTFVAGRGAEGDYNGPQSCGECGFTRDSTIKDYEPGGGKVIEGSERPTHPNG